MDNLPDLNSIEADALSADRVPKIIGCDAELANFINGVGNVQGTGALASRMLLREITGVSSACSAHNQDWGRKFLPNGACAYIDLDHLELPLPEVTSAQDYVAAWHAMLRIARAAQEAATARLNPGLKLEVLANNSDGLGNSYAHHLSFLMSRRAFGNLLHRKLHQLLVLASFQASSIVITGQGKVGSENGAPAVDYQISQRADFFETLFGLQTTHNRPLVNTRDEALCGGSSGSHTSPALARLHVIFYDSNLCHVACFLKVGLMQIMLAMIETGCVNTSLMLDDPISSAVRWSHDPTLKMKAKLTNGTRVTAVELQRRFFDEAAGFEARGGCEGVVPQAGEILSLWDDVLRKLEAREFEELSRALDWVLKRCILERAMANHSELTWRSPQVKHLDHLYSSLDPDCGLYWAYERAGVVSRLASDEKIERFTHEPAGDTRAWTRAMLLQRAKSGDVAHIDWDHIEFHLRDPRGWRRSRTVWMTDPAQWTKAETGYLFQPQMSLAEIVDHLTEREDRPSSSTFPSDWHTNEAVFQRHIEPAAESPAND